MLKKTVVWCWLLVMVVGHMGCSSRECRSQADCKDGFLCSIEGTCIGFGKREDIPGGQENTISEADGGDTKRECVDGEKRRCSQGKKAMPDVGVCRMGEQYCNGGVWGDCVGQVLPSKEVCDGLDNDCDGEVDEDTQGCNGSDCTKSGCQSPLVCDQQTKKCVASTIGGCRISHCTKGLTCNQKTGICEKEPGVDMVRCGNRSSCGQGWFCYRFGSQTNGICYRDCTKDASVCGSDSCNELIYGLRGCAKKVGKGESCGSDKQAFCDSSKTPLVCSKSTEKCIALTIQTKEGAPCSRGGTGEEPRKECDPTKQLFCDQASGTCRRKGTVGVAEKCDNQQTFCDRANKHVCVSLDPSVRHGYCFAPCSRAIDNQCQGECVQLTGGGYFCYPEGKNKEGDLCGFTSSSRGLKMDQNDSCLKGFSCTRAFTDQSPRRCFLHCETKDDVRCVGNDGKQGQCIPYRGISGYFCVKYGTKKEGELCGQDEKSPYDAQKNCEKGLACVQATKTNLKGICAKSSFNGCSSLQCGQGQKCVEYSAGRAACLTECTSSPSLCKTPGTICQSLQSTGKYCVAGALQGTKKYGELCSPKSTLPSQSCAKNGLCLESQNSGKGFCSSSCSKTSPCSSVTNAQGKTIQGSCESSICLFPCSSSQKTPCPDGMTCKAGQSGKEYCLPQ